MVNVALGLLSIKINPLYETESISHMPKQCMAFLLTQATPNKSQVTNLGEVSILEDFWLKMLQIFCHSVGIHSSEPVAVLSKSPMKWEL